MTEVKAKRTPVDWESVGREYRIGVRSLKDIGGEFHVSDAGIIKRAKKEGWTRNLSAKIQAKAETLVSEREVSAEVSSQTKLAERMVVDVNAQMLADKIINQREDIRRSRATVQRLWAIVDAKLDHPKEFERIGEILRSEDEFGQDKLNDMYRAAISIPQQVKNVKLLCDALKVLVELERKVLKLDTLPDPDPDEAARKAGEAAGRAVATGIDAAMQTLEKKLAAKRG